MSTGTDNHRPYSTGDIGEGLNSRYNYYEHTQRDREAAAAQDWFDRINKHTELNTRMGGLFQEIRIITPQTEPPKTGIVVDDQHIINLRDME